jgi:hypothetical protein
MSEMKNPAMVKHNGIAMACRFTEQSATWHIGVTESDSADVLNDVAGIVSTPTTSTMRTIREASGLLPSPRGEVLGFGGQLRPATTVSASIHPDLQQRAA